MGLRLLALFSILGTLGLPANPASCESLKSLSWPAARITLAEPVGAFTPPGGNELRDLPAFCRIAATLAPSGDSDIKSRCICMRPGSALRRRSTRPKKVADRTRPLCPYPPTARYKGAGSLDEASSFACVQ